MNACTQPSIRRHLRLLAQKPGHMPRHSPTQALITSPFRGNIHPTAVSAAPAEIRAGRASGNSQQALVAGTLAACPPADEGGSAVSTTLTPAPSQVASRQEPPGETCPERSRGNGLDLSSYDSQAYNILSPVLRLDTAAPYLRFRAVEVRLDPDANRGDCYAAPGTKWTRDRRTGELLPTHVAPAKPGLLKIASAAGLVIDPHNSRRIKPDACERCIDMARAIHAAGSGQAGQAVRCGDCPSRYDVAYQHIGAVRTDTGWRIVKASYEWNLDAQRRKILREGKKRLAKAQEEGKPFDLEDYVEDRLDQVIAERFGLAETKSLLRLVRAICHLRQAYLREEMARPFVVVRTELAPDFADPAVRRALAQKALASGAEIFGPVHEETPAAALRAAAVDVQVVEQLASEPDFADAEARAEEATAPVDDELAPDNGQTHVTDDAPNASAHSPVAEPPAEESSADHDSGEAPHEGADAVRCDDCNAALPANVVAYCQSAKGRQDFGGANYCFKCQNKRRGKGEKGDAR